MVSAPILHANGHAIRAAIPMCTTTMGRTNHSANKTDYDSNRAAIPIHTGRRNRSLHPKGSTKGCNSLSIGYNRDYLQQHRLEANGNEQGAKCTRHPHHNLSLKHRLCPELPADDYIRQHCAALRVLQPNCSHCRDKFLRHFLGLQCIHNPTAAGVADAPAIFWPPLPFELSLERNKHRRLVQRCLKRPPLQKSRLLINVS